LIMSFSQSLTEQLSSGDPLGGCRTVPSFGVSHGTGDAFRDSPSEESSTARYPRISPSSDYACPTQFPLVGTVSLPDPGAFSDLFMGAHSVPPNSPLEKRQILQRPGRALCLSRLSNLREKWHFPGKACRRESNSLQKAD